MDLWYVTNVMNPVALPLTAVCYIATSLNVVLLWIEVAKRSVRNQQNIGRRSKMFLGSMAFSFGVLCFVSFVVLNNPKLASLCSVMYMVAIIGIDIFAAAKMRAALQQHDSRRTKALAFVQRTAKRMVMWNVMYVLSAAGFAIVPPRRTEPTWTFLRQLLVFGLVQSVGQGLWTILRYVGYNTRRARSTCNISVSGSSYSETN